MEDLTGSSAPCLKGHDAKMKGWAKEAYMNMMKTTSAVLLAFLLSLAAPAAAQSPEQYKKWETQEFLDIRNNLQRNLELSPENADTYLDKALDKLEKALVNDANNPLLLSLAGYVASEKAKKMFEEKQYDAYSSSLINGEGGENTVLQRRREQAYQLSQQAENYLLKAVAQNEQGSMIDLADYYRSGYVSRSVKDKKVAILYSTEKSVPWLKKAQALGNQQASISLGELYIKGEAVEKDVKLGEKLISGAAEDPSEIYLQLGVSFADGYGNPRNPSSASRAPGDIKPYEYFFNAETSFYFLKKAADGGNIGAAFFLALSYSGLHEEYNGSGWRSIVVDQDSVKAFTYMKKAAVNADDTIYPWYYLAMFYLDGFGTPKNPRQALDMMEKIATGNNDWDKAAIKEMIRKEREKLK